MICISCNKIFEIDWRKNATKNKLCLYCCRGCSNRRKHTEETKLKMSNSIKMSEKAIEARIKRTGVKMVPDIICFCMECGKEFKIRNCKKSQKYCSFERRAKNSGGYRRRSGSVYSGICEGIYCSSTWEMWYILYCRLNNISIKRNLDYYNYVNTLGEIRKYYPDFRTDTGFVEVKGDRDKEWNNKLNWFPYKDKLQVIGRKEIQHIIRICKNNGLSLPVNKHEKEIPESR